MRISRLTFWVVVLALALSSSAFAWGPATHTYIANQLQGPGEKPDQMYGAVTPDINLLLSADAWSPYFQMTHHEFAVWNTSTSSDSKVMKALAYGYTTHNEDWGADYTAHIHSLAYPEFAQGGYVIKKSAELCAVLQDAYGNQIPDGILTLDNCHFILEYGLDLMVKMKDPAIGAKVMQSARHRSPQIAALLVAAYPEVDPAPKFGLPAGTTYGMEFAIVEPIWREKMIQYGDILMLPSDKALPALAAFLNQMAHDLGVLPGQLDATQLIAGALGATTQICAPDFGPELKATVANVALNLQTNGVK